MTNLQLNVLSGSSAEGFLIDRLACFLRDVEIHNSITSTVV